MENYNRDNIFVERISEDKSHYGGVSIRTFLDIPLLNNRDKVAMAIMINPSDADRFSGDATVNFLVDYFERKNIDVSRLIIHNASPIVDSKSKNLKSHHRYLSRVELLNSLFKMNEKSIQDSINYYNLSYIFLGWGGLSSIDKATHDLITNPLLNFLESNHNNKLYVFDTGADTVLVDGIYPRHPKPAGGQPPAKNHLPVNIKNGRIVLV